MAEALAHVKRCFGPDAVILSTRTVSQGGLLGIKAKPIVEITAARESPALADVGRTRRLAATPRPAPARLPLVSSERGAASYATTEAAPAALMREFGDLKSLMSDLMVETRRRNLSAAPKRLHEHYRNLLQNAVAEEVALSLVRRLEESLTPAEIKNGETVRQKLSSLLVESIPTAGPIVPTQRGEPYIAALIGPTGVGKTTTVAKLAANFSLRERKKVGLITLDTYRIAAVEQLKTYANIIEVPLRVAMSAEEYRDAVMAMQDRDVILVDSAGRSQRDAMKIGELKEFFALAQPHETHLVLSSAAGERVIHQAIERFSEIGFDRIIFTKLDEAVGFGVILGALQKVRAKLSYITTGQDVPSDIEVGASEALARLILGGESNETPLTPGVERP